MEKTLIQKDGLKIINNEIERLNSLVERAGYEDEFSQTLVKSADNFIVHRNRQMLKL